MRAEAVSGHLTRRLSLAGQIARAKADSGSLIGHKAYPAAGCHGLQLSVLALDSRDAVADGLER